MKNSRIGSLARASALVVLVMAAGTARADRHEKWVEARSPNFIVVTDAGEKQARKTAIQFEQIRAVFRETLTIASEHPSPLITIIAVKDQNGMRQLVPEDWAVKGHAHHAGWFAYAMDRYYAAVELDASGDNPYETLYHEYYHSLTMPYIPYMPPWLAEGLAEFFGHTEVQGKEVLMGEPDRDRMAELAQTKLIPLDVLFTVDRNSPYYNEENKTSLFYLESWALTHYLFFHDRDKHTHSLDDYLNAIAQGATEQQAAAKAFGDTKKLQAALANYVADGQFDAMRGPAPAKIADSDIQVREISDAEAEAYRGGLMAARNRPSDAIPVLKNAIQEDPKLAMAYENLALAEFLARDLQAAGAAASQAISLGSKMPLARYLRAFATYRTDPGTPNPQIEDDLRQCIGADANYAPAYALLASYLANQDENLDQALTLAQKAVALEPGSTGNQIAVAQVLARMRRFDEAQLAALRARQGAATPQQQQEADRFLTYLGTVRGYSDEGATGDGGSSASLPSVADNTANGTTRVVGSVMKADCSNGLELDLATDSGLLRLHAEMDGGIMIRRRPGDPVVGTPCSLKGQRLAVWYTPAEGKPNEGTLRVLQVLRSDDDTTRVAATADSARAETAPGNHPVGTPTGPSHVDLSGMTQATGTVTASECANGELKLEVSTESGKLQVHGKQVGGPTIMAQSNFPDDFDPCSMKGQEVRVWYAPDGGTTASGTMKFLELLNKDKVEK